MTVFAAPLGFAEFRTEALSQRAPSSRLERFAAMSRDAEERGLAEAFRGVTTNGTVRPGLFAIRSTGVSTEPVRKAAEAFLNALSPERGCIGSP